MCVHTNRLQLDSANKFMRQNFKDVSYLYFNYSGKILLNKSKKNFSAERYKFFDGSTLIQFTLKTCLEI